MTVSPERITELLSAWADLSEKAAEFMDSDEQRAEVIEEVVLLRDAAAALREAQAERDAARGGVEELAGHLRAASQQIREAQDENALLREALALIAAEDDGDDYDVPAWDDVRRIPATTFRAPAVARAVLSVSPPADEAK